MRRLKMMFKKINRILRVLFRDFSVLVSCLKMFLLAIAELLFRPSLVFLLPEESNFLFDSSAVSFSPSDFLPFPCKLEPFVSDLSAASLDSVATEERLDSKDPF